MGSTVSVMAKSVLKELDPDGVLIPVSSIIDSEKYKPLCLVVKMNLAWKPVWERYKYVNTGFKLTDVMKAGDPGGEIEILHSEPYKITDTVEGMLASNVAVSGQPVNMEIEGGANISRSRSLTVTKTYVTQTDLESLKNKRTIDMSQTLIKDLEQRNQNVYVITESIETEQEATINTSDSFQAGFSFFSKVGIKSKGKKTKTISIPKGSVFGFRAQLLTIQNGKWAVSHDPNAYGNTFEEKKELILASYVSETDTLTGFPRVKAEILNQCSPLNILPPEEVEDVLKAFLFIMKNPKTISEVEAKVEQVLYSSAHNESSILLELLEELGISKAPKTSYKVLIDLTFFFLNALNGLDEDGVSMLVESVEKQNTEHQLTQVETLLAENFISSEEHDDCQITIGESRPRPILEANGGASESWNLMVQSYAIALYAALCLLHRLSLRSLSTKPKLSSA